MSVEDLTPEEIEALNVNIEEVEEQMSTKNIMINYMELLMCLDMQGSKEK